MSLLRKAETSRSDFKKVLYLHGLALQRPLCFGRAGYARNSTCSALAASLRQDGERDGSSCSRSFLFIE